MRLFRRCGKKPLVRSSPYKCYRSDKKCAPTVSPTAKGLTITPTDWQNIYFKEQITIVGLSGITLQIQQLDFS
jgi:hypothetical protein